MLSILIVDDEFLARVGLSSFIDWIDHDYQIIGEAQNGKQGLELAERLEPDIIISDIQMPIMNGIELIEAAQAKGLKAKFVMLSSYDDFALVKGALKAGAEDYILKLQMESDSLLEVLAGVKQKIASEQAAQKSATNQLAELKRDQDLLRQALLRDLFNGKVLDTVQIQQQLQEHQLDLHSHYVVSVAIRCPELANDDGRSAYALVELLRRHIQQQGSAQLVCYDAEIYVGLCSFDQQHTLASVDQQIAQLCQGMLAGARNTLNRELNLGVSRVNPGLSLLRQSYMQAMYALTQGNGALSYYRGLDDREFQQWLSQMDKHIAQLAAGLERNHPEKITRGFDALIDGFGASTALTPDLVLGNSYVLNYLVQDFVRRNKLDKEPLWLEIQASWGDRTQLKDLSEYLRWISLLKELVLRLFNQESESHRVITRAKQYVQEHLDQTISLNDMSQHLDLSPSYFSRLFSQQSKQRFVDYVRQQKMQHAQTLIRDTNLKMYQVAIELGYDNMYYFSRVFKQTTGMSPSEYRHQKL